MLNTLGPVLNQHTVVHFYGSFISLSGTADYKKCNAVIMAQVSARTGPVSRRSRRVPLASVVMLIIVCLLARAACGCSSAIRHHMIHHCGAFRGNFAEN